MTTEQTTKTGFSTQDSGSGMGSVASDIRDAASQKFSAAMTEMRSRADDTKADVASEVKDVAKALRRASDELRDGSAQERTLGQISTSLADVSDAIRDKDMGQMLQMASRVARENPLLFLGGAALLGFAASRYAKATGHHARETAAEKTALHKAQVEVFVDEGNPNTQPVKAAT